jgi:hypothetical protein
MAINQNGMVCFVKRDKELNFEFYYLIFQCIKRAKKGKWKTHQSGDLYPVRCVISISVLTLCKM